MEADEDGRGLHLQPPSASPTSDALSTSGDSNISLLQSLSVNDNGDPGSPAAANLDEIDHQLGINFHHLLDIPFHQVPQSDHLPHHHDDNQTTPSTLQHQIDLNLDALLSNAGTFFFPHSGHNWRKIHNSGSDTKHAKNTKHENPANYSNIRMLCKLL